MYIRDLTLPIPIPDEEKKFTYIFTFTLLCGTSKGKAFIKPFEAPQRSVKVKIFTKFFHFVRDWAVKG